MSLRDQLQEIYEAHGKLTPELVVQVARPKNHPLHDRVFDRNVAEAAEVYYRDRAHELIRSVRVVYREATETNDEASIRAFHATRATDSEYEYKPVEEIVESEFLVGLVLRDMEREWKALHRRYGNFKEFLVLVRRDVDAA